MAQTVNGASLAIDQQGLDQLKRTAKDKPQEAVRQAATQFEAMFMNMLLKSMRETLPGGDPMSSEAGKTYTGMLDAQLSQKLAGKGMGLAEMMVKQLERAQAGVKSVAERVTGTASPAAASSMSSPAAPAATPGTVETRSSDAKSFVSRMENHAKEAARESGIPAHFMIGQAALESGWGKREIRAADGTNSHNVFGIKATGDWKGATVAATTTEYVNGVAQKVVQKFRAYESYGDAFRDYAKLVGNSPRYAAAARSGGDAQQFAQRIQAAGYATDPRYADKLARVIGHARQLSTSA